MLLNILLKTSLSLRTRFTKYLIYCFVFSITAVLFIPGCSDDTVSSNFNIDLPRFNWRKVNLNADAFNNVWAKDTGNVYLLNSSGTNLYKLSGGNLTNFYIGENYTMNLSGNESNVIIFALTQTFELKFIFWNGYASEISTGIFLTDTTGFKFIGFATDDLGTWLCSQSGIVSYNNGNLFYYFIDDPSFIPLHIYKSELNSIRITGISNYIQKIYELQGNSFVKIFEYSGNYNLKVMNNNAFGYNNMNGPCFYTISGNNFIESSCINTNIPVIFGGFNGTSFNNILYEVNSNALFNEICGIGILHWDGVKLSREFELEIEPAIYQFTSIININQEDFLILEGENLSKTLYIGTKK